MKKVGFVLKFKDKELRKKTSLNMNEEDLFAYLKILTKKMYLQNPQCLNIEIKIIDSELNIKILEVDKENNISIVKETNKSEEIRKILNKKDVQQYTLYSWEGETFRDYGIYQSIFDRKKMIRYINFVLEKLEVPELDIYFKGASNSSSFNFNFKLDNNNIALHFSDLTLNKFIALHEISHYLCFYYRLEDNGGHGKHFVGIYVYLLNRFMNINKEYMYKTLEEKKLKYISLEQAKKILTKGS